MPAGNSIIGDCAECCVCPDPILERDSRSKFLTKTGFKEGRGFTSTPPKLYRTATGTGIAAKSLEPLPQLFSEEFSGSITLPFGVNPEDDPDSYSTISQIFRTAVGGSLDCSSTGDIYETRVITSYDVTILFNDTQYVTSSTAISAPATSFNCGSVTWMTLSNEYTTAQLISNVESELPEFSNSWNSTSWSFSFLASDESQYSIAATRYRFRFKIPIGFFCYRLSWVERFIPEAGVPLTSLEIITAGVYRPTVTLSAPPTGGTQARAIAVMSSTGIIASISITNPGSGYTSAPTVTVQAAINGGTSSTGWTATLTNGKVTAISGGSAGNYLPTLPLSGGGGSGAAATVAMDSTGGLASITFSSLGSGYTSAPSVSISSKVSGATAATLHLHLGTETAKCTEWDGTTPSGYDPNTSSTWPTLPSASPGYFEIPVPSSEGTTTVANVRAFCDCSSCP